MHELTIQDIFRILRKSLAFIIIIPMLIAIMAGVYYYRFAADVYTAEVSLFVMLDYQDSLGNVRYDVSTSSSFVQDYEALFRRSPVIEETQKQLELANADPISELHINVVNESHIVEMSISGTDPQFCANVVNVASEIFVRYLKKIMNIDTISIIQPADVPMVPSGPNRARNIVLIYLVVLMCCMGMPVALEMLNVKIRTEAQVEEILNLPVLAKIFDYRKELMRYMERECTAVNRLYDYVPVAIRESVKTLATNVCFSSVGRPIRCITITSTGKGEGKSSISVLLASALAEEGKTVLVVNMDFRDPTIGKYFKMRNRLDLCDLLSGNAVLDDVIMESGVANVYFVDSNHYVLSLPRIVQSEGFDQFLHTVTKTFDLVLFDAPPLGLFVDAAVLASKMDGAIFVIKENETEIAEAKSTVDQLGKSGVSILGAVLSSVKKVHHGNNYYNKYYGRYYGKNNEKRPSQYGKTASMKKKASNSINER